MPIAFKRGSAESCLLGAPLCSASLDASGGNLGRILSYAAFRSLQKNITKSFFARITILECGQVIKLGFTHIPEPVPVCFLSVDKSSFFRSNEVSLEIRHRITLANRYYFGIRKQLSKKALSLRTKICLLLFINILFIHSIYIFIYISLSYCRFYYMVLRKGRRPL